MYGQFDLPAPDVCPTCRLKHLFSFWIFGKFRKTTSALSNKSIITVLSDKVQFPIYDREEWIGDTWDVLSYGQEYDPARPFFEQFREVMNTVPHPHQIGTRNVNCPWTDDCFDCRECYLCRSMVGCEFLTYAYRCFDCKNSVDITYCYNTDFSYDCLYCFKCYKLQYAFNCRDCIESIFLYDCRNVQNCFMCWNLRNKQYCIRNKQYTKEEYFEKIKEFDTRSFQGITALREQFKKILEQEAVHRENFNLQVTHSTGNFMTECKNCIDCRFIERGENCRHCWRATDLKDCIDCVGNFNAEKSALVSLGEATYESIGTLYSLNCRYSAYLDYCQDVEYCFGCSGLKKKKYCILNKQYSKEDYEALLPKIKNAMRERGEWGKFFPMAYASAGYNLSLAQILFPDIKANVEHMGGWWQELKEPTHDGVSGDALPDRIDDVRDDITAQAVICPETKWRYNIAPRELVFYKEKGIPLPRRHPDWRTLNRFSLLGRAVTPREGICYYCKKAITHYFPSEFGYQKIACVDCYQKNIA